MPTQASATRKRPLISFEFFPPRTPRASMGLWTAVQRLAPLAPDFVSVTYGAGGTTRDRTMSAMLAIRDCARLSVAGHLTCVGASRDEVLRVARSYAKLGCRRIVALRGDAASGQDRFTPHPEGFAGSVELVAALAATSQFEIWVAAYPETHPEAASRQADIAHLKRKLDAGAYGAITQLFFDNEAFYRFRDECAATGITAPIVPGILPIEDFWKTVRFADSCATSIPDWMFTAFENAEATGSHDLLATAIATEQCDGLLSNGVDHLHFYTLNKADMVYNVCRALGIEPEPAHLLAGSG
jgi:methylenetetrahydrofolate reductase (NADPH)